MNIQKLKEDLFELLSRADQQNLERIFDILEKSEGLLSKKQSSEVISLKAKLKKHEDWSRKNLYHAGEREVNFGRILEGLLELIHSLGENQEEVVNTKKKTILFFAANPEQSSFLRLDKEFREIEELRKKSNLRDNFQLDVQLATRISDFSNAIIEKKPWMVHFAGHGTLSDQKSTEARQRGLSWPKAEEEPTLDSGIVLMSDDDKGSLYVSVEALGKYFSHFKDSVELVFLNSCYSGLQAEAIAASIPYVIGMKKAVADPVAIKFATSFYEAIFGGEEIPKAFELALGYLELSGYGGEEIPRLIRPS
ncbi:MAG: CHAT domain-containing protein [Bacteroidia bacterium]|nr:CHAT domain-containing protein [Bacteroidia bacterium]